VFFLPDQLRAQALGCMGDLNSRTPNIDRLASEGVLMRNTIANTPVCCPARANLLTGRYAHKNGMVANDLRLRESETTMSQMLASAGYRTGFTGKWHLDGGPRMPGYVPPGPRRHGFEFWAANECNHSHFDSLYFRDSPEPILIRTFEPEVWIDRAIEFVQETKSDLRPFFLSIQMGPPHDPYKAPSEYSRNFDPAKLKMRTNWQEGVPGGSRQNVAEYYAMLSAVDDQVGRLMRALDELRLRDDTIVILSSDHGDMLASHGQRLKRKPWEESIRVPGVVRYPRRIRAGSESNVLFTHVDIAPTLLSMCGLEIPRTMQGTDLSPILLGAPEANRPDSAFLQIFGPFRGDGTVDGWRGLRTRRHLYARYRYRPWVLYDLEDDPFEMRNLVGDIGSEKILRSLDEQLSETTRRAGDAWGYNWTYPVEDDGRLYKDRAYYSVGEYLRDRTSKTANSMAI
jgi:arylsulfatase A-like enzyme